MRKYITVKIPVLDDVDEMKVVDTFNEEQLWYVCALAHAYEKLENKSKKQQERIDKLRECIKTSYVLKNILMSMVLLLLIIMLKY
mgnify:CR=1 FL=1